MAMQRAHAEQLSDAVKRENGECEPRFRGSITMAAVSATPRGVSLCATRVLAAPTEKVSEIP